MNGTVDAHNLEFHRLNGRDDAAKRHKCPYPSRDREAEHQQREEAHDKNPREAT